MPLSVCTVGVLEVGVITSDSTVGVGHTALLTCIVYGEPSLEMSWSFNGAVVMNSSLVTIYEEDIVKGGRVFRQSFLQICSLSASDDGDYTCIVNNGFISANATTQLDVDGKDIGFSNTFLNASHYTVGPLEVAVNNDTSVDAGQTAVLICIGYGEPRTDISWSFNGAVLTNSSLATIYEDNIVSGGRVFKLSYLELCSLVESNAGGYTCTVSNGPGIANATTQLSVEG